METRRPQEVTYEGVHCNLTIQRFEREIVVVRISGTDVGEFGGAPFQKLNESLAGVEQVKLFIDARDVRGASIDVSGDWAQWLSQNKFRLDLVSMLTGSRLVEVTAASVRRFSELQGIMQVYTEPAAFDAGLREALAQGSI